MKTCPACHRTVPDDAAVCPHAGCGKPLAAVAGGVKKRPPPPGPVRLSASDVPHGQSVGQPVSLAARGHTRRGPATTIALIVLLCLLVGGIYYAAVVLKPARVEPVQQVARESADGKQATDSMPPKLSEDAAGKTDDAAKPVTVPDGEQTAPMDEAKPSTEVAAAVVPAEPLGLYSERTRADREQWIAGVGGTPESEVAVAAGLDWLARHQAEDGHWGPDCLGPQGSRCEKEHPCDGPGQNFEAALTGLAVLAFQAGGHYDFNDHRYSRNVRQAIDWFVERQGPNGEILGSLNQLGQQPGAANYDPRYMYEHAIATFALAEACAVARAAQRHPDEKYLAAAIKAVKFIEDQQHSDGGWRYRPIKSDPSDTSISGWAMLALKTAKEADLRIDANTISRMTAFFKRSAQPLTGRTHYQGAQFVTDATTGVGMLVEEFINHQPDSELVQLASSYLADQAEARWGEGRDTGSDFYLWYNCTLAMFMAGGEPWTRWNDVVRNHIISLAKEGSDCDRGSWAPIGQWGGEGGRVFSTALAVLSLEVYYRFARERTDRGPAKPK